MTTTSPETARSEENDPEKVQVDAGSRALNWLLILAVFYTLYFAQTFFVPLVLALLLSFLFSPLVRKLARIGLPETVTAAFVVLGLVATIGIGAYQLSAPASEWINRAPQSIGKLESTFKKLRRPMDQMSKAADQVEKATGSAGGALKVEIQEQSAGEAVFGGTQTLLAGVLVVGVVLFFLLASGDMFLTKVIRVLPKLEDKKRAVQIARETEDQISSYLGATTGINIAFGAVVAVAMKLLEMPNPLLWGVVAGLTNFIPYLGGIACTLILGIVALLETDSLTRAFTVSGVFFVLNTLEGSFITPMILGHKMKLNPVVIFIGVLLWGWLWGIPGMLLAVPILATIKIVCDRVENLGPLGEFLGQ